MSFVPEEVDRYSLFPLIHPEQIDIEEDFGAIETFRHLCGVHTHTQ